MDIQTTATIVLSILSPYLAKIGETLAGKAGGSIYKKAQELHKIIKKRFEGDQTAESALRRVEKDPSEANWQNILLGVLIIKMEEDPTFAATIKEFVEDNKDMPEAKRIIQNLNISGQTTGSVFQIGEMHGGISQKDK